MRRFVAPAGYVLGPIIGSLYYMVVRLTNGGRRLVMTTATPPGATKPVLYLFINNARFVPSGCITFGHRIYCSRGAASARLIRHELVHVEQFDRYGWLGFFARYGYEQIARGYRDNLIEVEARQRAGV